MTDNFQVILQVPVEFEPQIEDARVAVEPDAFLMRVPVTVAAEQQRDRPIHGDQDQGTS